MISSRAPGPDLEYPRFHAMGDAELLRTLREYDVLPLEVLDDPELREISLATLRADSRLAADYRYRPREPLAIPITAILGEQDPGVSGWPSTAGGGTPAATSWRPWPAATAWW